MVQINNGIYKYIKDLFKYLDFEMFYQSHINQLTIYINDSISQNEYNRFQVFVSKYIGENMLSDSYSTIKYFR